MLTSYDIKIKEEGEIKAEEWSSGCGNDKGNEVSIFSFNQEGMKSEDYPSSPVKNEFVAPIEGVYIMEVRCIV